MLPETRLALILIVVAVFAVLATFGCSDIKHPTTDRIKIAYVAKLKDGGFHDAIFKGAREESVKQSVDVDVFYGHDQQDLHGQQRFLTEILQSKKYKGVMLAPNDSAALINDVAQLDAADIPFILVDTPLADTPVTRNFSHDCGFVGTNNVLAGKLAAEFVSEHISEGNIVLMRGNHQHQSSIDRESGFVRELDKHPGLHIVRQLVGWWKAESALSAYSSFMKSNKKPIHAVFAYSDPMAIGVSQHYENTPGKPKPIIVGVDGVLLGQRAVLAQKINASVVQSPEVMGKVGLQQIVNCIVGRIPQKEQILTPVTLLSASVTLERMGGR